MIGNFYGLLASFFLFASFILSLFVVIGHLSAQPFLNVLYFAEANNPHYNLTYSFGLWSYCEGPYGMPPVNCSKPIPAFDWYDTPGFREMLPSQASSSSVNLIFFIMFIFYFVGLGFSFILWLISLPFSVFCCFDRRFRNRPGGKPFDVILCTWTCITFLVMLAALIMMIVMVVNFSKDIASASSLWFGHAGVSLWMTIGIVVALFFATLCYGFKSCFTSKNQRVEDAKDYASTQYLPPPPPKQTSFVQRSHLTADEYSTRANTPSTRPMSPA